MDDDAELLESLMEVEELAAVGGTSTAESTANAGALPSATAPTARDDGRAVVVAALVFEPEADNDASAVRSPTTKSAVEEDGDIGWFPRGLGSTAISDEARSPPPAAPDAVEAGGTLALAEDAEEGAAFDDPNGDDVEGALPIVVKYQ